MSTEQLFPVLWRRRWSFLFSFVVVLGTVAAVTLKLPKVYLATSYLLVAPAKPAASDFETSQVSETLTKTYGELLQTARTADEVQTALGNDVADGDVGNRVEVELGDNQVIKITAEAGNSREAQLIANTYAGVFAEGSARFSNASAAQAIVTVAQSAVLPEQPSRPRPKLYVLIGAVFATMAAGTMALLRHRFDQRLDLSLDDLEILGLPVLGRIPETQRPLEWATGLPRRSAQTETSADAFRLLLVNVSFVNLGERPKTLAVVSAAGQEGKSTCALSLGRAAAETGAATLVADADLRRPTLGAKMGDLARGATTGLSNFLVNTPLALSEAVIVIPGGLDVLTAGPLPPNPAPLLASKGFTDFDVKARAAYDLVVYDTPPVSVGPDASLLAAQADGVVLVIDARSTRRDSALQAIDQLRRARANLLGVVLNRAATGNGVGGYYHAKNPSADPSPPSPAVPVEGR